MAYLDPVAGASRESGISPGALSADVAGRSIMGTGYFDAATVASKFGTDSFTSAVLLQLIQDGAFAAAAANRALFADRFLPYAKITLRDVEAHTAGDTLLAAESGSTHTNTGASGAVTLVLPAATVGQEFFFVVGAAQELRLDPNTTETISLPSTGVAGAAGKYLTTDAIGESIHILCALAGTWAVVGYTGTWTSE